MLRCALPGLLVLNGAGARDDGEAGQLLETTRDLLGHPVGEVLIVRRAEVFEREDNDYGRTRATDRACRNSRTQRVSSDTDDREYRDEKHHAVARG